MKSEFTLAFNEIAERSHLDRETIIEALEMALVQAYRKSVTASEAQDIVARVEPETGQLSVFAEKEVVDEPQDDRTEVALHVAREVAPEVQLGDLLTVNSTPAGFGRIAAQTAKQVILQKLKEAERESQYQEFIEREGDIIHGTVQSYGAQGVTLSLGRAEAQMPRNQQMPGERYRTHEKVRFYVLEVRKTSRGPQIIVSRTHRNLLRRLLEMEVPEIYNGVVEIKSIAREAGYRSKVAVTALQQGVDPVGACVGMRGMRIQSIVKELHGEKIDVIQWNTDVATFISKALSPARVASVHLEDASVEGRTATVIVPDDQLSLAIGREGQNARLAAKLTGWRIDIKSMAEAAREAVELLQDDERYADLAPPLQAEMERAGITLTKMTENRPIMPEEYTTLNTLVDTVEQRCLEMQATELAERRAVLEAVRASIRAPAYECSLQEADVLSERLLATLQEADYQTVGQVLEELAMNPDAILALHGVGPKVLEKLLGTLTELAAALPEPEPEPEPEEEVAAAEESAVADASSEQPVAAAEPADEPEEPAEAEADIAEEPVVQPAHEPVPEDWKEDEPDIDQLLKPEQKKKKQRKKRTVVFDDERGVFITSHAHKRDADQFEWDEEL
ncbi:MAG: transcription termination factor NusA [Anaerolineales bacterium]|jgi:N utilization substance protein A|nr:transcription termination factor NusA [Anaerolineales bacterium]HJN40814.1 transcription termination factor NusA [Anaerolineales bacterium]|tara:strand:- start:9735 stop:11597 length:1863 start_codon:yes stop_codon:yes gene_type:complete